MARASTYTGLSIDEWAAILGISPWEINQFKWPGQKSAQCNDIFFQFQYQRDHLSREEIAEAIFAAEAMIAEQCLFYPYPHFEVGEIVKYPRPHQRQLFGYAGTSRGEWKSAGARWHKFISGGVLNRTHLGTITGNDLQAFDRDGDNVKETFVATITDAAIASIADVNEIALYFITADRHDEPLDETWRIRPIKVSVSGNTATITGHRTLLTNPTPEYATNAQELDAGTDANYVTSVECYRTFVDTTATEALPYQGVAMWSTIPGCTDGCTFSIRHLCLADRFDEQGQIAPDFGSSCDWPFPTREPDRLSINYVSGVPLVNGRMEKSMAQIVAYLSVSLLANEACGCERTNRILARLRAPTLKFQDNTAGGAMSFQESTNAFPQTFGGQWAWSRVQQLRHIEAVSI